MPFNLKNILESLISNKSNFCALCYNIIERVENVFSIKDKVLLKSACDISLWNILNFILTPEVTKGFLTNFICIQCTKTAIESYLFSKMIKDNIDYLSNVINNSVNNCKSTMEEDLECIKTIFLLTSDISLDCQKYLDDKCDIKSITTAKLRLQSILADQQQDIISIELVPDHQPEHKINKCKKNRIDHTKIDSMSEIDGDSKIKCKTCLKAYPTKANFRNHFTRVHAPKTIRCSKCPKQFGSTVILEQHMSESHVEAMCSECGKVYNNKHYLKQHELTHKVSFPCNICKRAYKTRETYRTHLNLNICSQKQRKSQFEGEFTCNICKKMYCRKTSLKAHMNVEHGFGKAYACFWCSKRFRAQSVLNAHMLKHSKVKKFSCSVCNQNFSTKSTLKVHTRMHTGERPFKCCNCDAEFISSSRKLAHTHKCNKNFTFECPVCHCKFKYKRSLENHQQRLKCKNKDETNGTTNYYYDKNEALGEASRTS